MRVKDRSWYERGAHDRLVKDVIVTVIVAIVLAIAFMYVLLSLAFSGWRDPPRPGSTIPPSLPSASLHPTLHLGAGEALS